MKAYNQQNIPLAKALRRNMTPWERKLWYDFLRQYPIRFQRQKAIGDYIVDFYCAKAKLVVELDGGGHYEPAQIQADQSRTAKLEQLGLQVLRICNLDVDRNFRGVCEHIDRLVQQSLPQSASLTAPSSEGAFVPGFSREKQKQIIALGFFDGVHLGHQALLRACVRLAREGDMTPAAITFSRHPQSLFTDRVPKLINTPADREALLRQFGMETIHKFPVTKEVMSTNWQVFLKDLLRQGAGGFVCGEDFHFGHKGEGDSQKLEAFCRERGLPCVIVPQQTLDGIRVSSTHIRDLIEHGDMQTAARFLGHPHLFTGMVVPGKRLGRTLGIPTANLVLPQDVVQPKKGVYACQVHIGEKICLAVTNVGSRPTVSGDYVTVEPWILDFEGDLYGKEITLEFHAFLRPERKFGSLEELREEIRKNAEQTRAYFKK